MGDGHTHAAKLTLGGRSVFAVAAARFLWEQRVGNVWEGRCVGRVSLAVTHCLSLRLFWSDLSKSGLCFPLDSLLAVLQTSVSYCCIIGCLTSHPNAHDFYQQASIPTLRSLSVCSRLAETAVSLGPAARAPHRA